MKNPILIKNKKGFTLIELIVVIAILGILAAIVAPQFNGFQEKARVAADETTAKIIADAFNVLITEGAVSLDNDGVYLVYPSDDICDFKYYNGTIEVTLDPQVVSRFKSLFSTNIKVQQKGIGNYFQIELRGKNIYVYIPEK